MSWVVYVSYDGGQLTPLFKAHSQERAVELVEQFRQQHPVSQFVLCREDVAALQLTLHSSS